MDHYCAGNILCCSASQFTYQHSIKCQVSIQVNILLNTFIIIIENKIYYDYLFFCWKPMRTRRVRGQELALAFPPPPSYIETVLFSMTLWEGFFLPIGTFFSMGGGGLFLLKGTLFYMWGHLFLFMKWGPFFILHSLTILFCGRSLKDHT